MREQSNCTSMDMTMQASAGWWEYPDWIPEDGLRSTLTLKYTKIQMNWYASNDVFHISQKLNQKKNNVKKSQSYGD